jgi:hypothetical protein
VVQNRTRSAAHRGAARRGCERAAQAVTGRALVSPGALRDPGAQGDEERDEADGQHDVAEPGDAGNRGGGGRGVLAVEGEDAAHGLHHDRHQQADVVGPVEDGEGASAAESELRIQREDDEEDDHPQREEVSVQGRELAVDAEGVGRLGVLAVAQPRDEAEDHVGESGVHQSVHASNLRICGVGRIHRKMDPQLVPSRGRSRAPHCRGLGFCPAAPAGRRCVAARRPAPDADEVMP